MTCVVGVVENGREILGADSAGVDPSDYSLQVRADRKVFRNGPFVMGFTTSFRMGQLLAHTFQPPGRRIDQDVFAFMVAEFVPAVRQCFERGGWAGSKEGVNFGGVFLVGYAGRLFAIQGDFQVSEVMCGFDAVGCGGELARGALWALKHLPARERIGLALQAAESMSAGVSEPFFFEELDAPPPPPVPAYAAVGA